MRVGGDKFYPPQVGTSRFLFRERVVDDLVRRCGSRKPIIVLEAQAGQGKTTVIKQFLDHLCLDTAWYQVTPEDADPAFFLVALRACLTHMLPQCPFAADIASQGAVDIARFDLPKRLDQLLGPLQDFLKKDLFFVFDDLHHLVAHEASLFIVSYLMANAPPQLHFVLSSREALPREVLRPLADGRDVVALGNRELALTDHEITDLFDQVFQVALSHEAVREISLKTDGWVMGTLLLGLQMGQGHGRSPGSAWGGAAGDDIREYFRRKVFAALAPRLREPLLHLSLLEDIPVPLAELLLEEPGIGKALGNLARRNIFIRRLDPGGTVFCLHHLFRQFLREKAATELDAGNIRQLYKRAGAYFFQRDNPAQALRYYWQARDYGAMEATLCACGAAMLATNQTATLAAILGDIPKPDLARLGWASLILALAQMDFAPARALPLLSEALAVFSRVHDESGELLCLAHIIAIHITTTGHYREGLGLLERAEDLFSRKSGQLDVFTTILVARSLAMGRCIFLADTEKSLQYATLALTLATKEELVNFEAALLMAMGYIRVFAGHRIAAKQWMERASAILLRPEVGTFNCLAIRMMLFNHLFHEGDFDNYFRQKKQLAADFGQVLFSQSIAGPFCHVWDMDIAINHGLNEEALAIAATALSHQPPFGPHLISQILQLKAVALALSGQPDTALAMARESTRLRELAGGEYFITLNTLLSGLIHGLCGRLEEAVGLLTAGIASSRRMPTEYLEACGLMHRAAVHLEGGDGKRAAEDLAAGLGLMRRNTYRHFWGWAPGALRMVLEFAVKRGIEVGYARRLAAERIGVSIRDNGKAVDHLVFRTLGDFSILHQGGVLLEAAALTPAQRELLCLLLTAPGLKMAQDSVQLHFWPDSSPSAAKVTFDTLVSRLRKTLAQALPQKAAPGYLLRDKGIIWLEHCRVDAHDFLDAVHRGLEHARMQEFWQAGNVFARADALWRGDFAPGVTGEDQVRGFRDVLVKARCRMVLTWCGLLARQNRWQEAMDLAEKGVRAAPLNDALWALLYRVQGRQSAIAARQVLARFASLLRAEDYPEDEIAEMLRIIASS